jgi:uncharacterized protein (TIGR00730 family)
MTDTNNHTPDHIEKNMNKHAANTYFESSSEPSKYEVIRFLEGPQEHSLDGKMLQRVNEEFEESFRVFGSIGPCVTFFGSARTKEDDPSYEMCRKTAELIAREGFTVMTGGGPGMMEAANRGAFEAGGRSIGASIELPHEEGANRFVNRQVSFTHFFVRKTILIKYSYGFIVMPGGIGTLDELSEILTLIQCGKIRDFPVVLMGSDYWSGLVDFMTKKMMSDGMIDPTDLDLFHVTDDPESACAFVTRIAVKRFELHKGAPSACVLDWKEMRSHESS